MPAAGTYRVSLWWTAAANRATNVPVTMAHLDGTVDVQVDQTVNGEQWNVLRSYTFGTSGTVVTVSNTDTDGYVMHCRWDSI